MTDNTGQQNKLLDVLRKTKHDRF